MSKAGIKQGISGQVLWREGNWMPSKEGSQRQEIPVRRVVYIYEAISLQELTKIDRFFEKPTKNPVKIIETDEKGFFLVELPAGKYSVLVEENTDKQKLLYANRFQDDYVNLVNVKNKQITPLTIIVDYKARY